jgi:hypothetical protein
MATSSNSINSIKSKSNVSEQNRRFIKGARNFKIFLYFCHVYSTFVKFVKTFRFDIVQKKEKHFFVELKTDLIGGSSENNVQLK